MILSEIICQSLLNEYIELLSNGVGGARPDIRKLRIPPQNYDYGSLLQKEQPKVIHNKLSCNLEYNLIYKVFQFLSVILEILYLSQIISIILEKFLREEVDAKKFQFQWNGVLNLRRNLGYQGVIGSVATKKIFSNQLF